MSRFAIAAGFAVLMTVQSASACVPITAVPYTISVAGKYCITGNLTMAAAGNAITINTDNVTLDFGGYELAGVGIGQPSNSGVILVNRSNIVIRNGSIRAFDSGIYSVTGLNVAVEDMSIRSVGTGISTEHGSHYSFRRNRIFDALYRGISLSQSLPFLINAQDQVANVSYNEISAVGGVNQASSSVVYGIYAHHNVSIVSNNKITGVRGAAGSAGIYLARGGVAVENTILAAAIGIGCEPNAPSEKAVRNVTGFGTPAGFTYCIGNENY
jgi:hypothetical protein